MKFSSKILNPKIVNDELNNAVSPAIYRSSAYQFQSAQEIHSAFAGDNDKFIYSRVGNPTVAKLEEKINYLHNGQGAVAFASGMAAISACFLALSYQGANIICSSCVFAGTASLLEKSFNKFGVEARYFTTGNEEEIEQLIDENTCLIITETINNPAMSFSNIEKISKIAEKNNIVFIVDATVTPPNIIDLDKYNISIIMHSTTKYISGQSRALGGILVDTGKYNWLKNTPKGMENLREKYQEKLFLRSIRRQYLGNFGASMSADVAELTLMGLETLSLRMEKISNNALKLATHLETLEQISKVHYPGLKSSQFHQVASNHLLDNQYSGFVAFDVGTQERAWQVINNLKLAQIMTNLGDIRTLVIHPYSTIYLSLDEQMRNKLGASAGLIRVSVGIENIDDLINDFTQACKNL